MITHEFSNKLSLDKTQLDESHLMVGFVLRPQGLQGSLRVRILSGDAAAIHGAKTIYCELKNGQFIELTQPSIKPVRDKDFFLRVSESSDRNHADKLVGSRLWIDRSHFVSQKGETIFLNELAEFLVKDVSTKSLLGQIKEFSSNGPQDLLGVHLESTGEAKRIWIPLVEALVPKIDYTEKTVFVELPEGFLELAEAL